MCFGYEEVERMDTDALALIYQTSFGQNTNSTLRDKLNADYIYIEIAARCLPLMPETTTVDHNFSMIDTALRKYDPESDTFEDFLMKTIQKN